MHAPLGAEDPGPDELLRRERYAADGLFERLDARGRGFLGASDVLEVLASGLLSGQPGVAKALAGAAVRSCGRLKRSDFLDAVVHEKEQASLLQSSFGAMSSRSEPVAQNQDISFSAGYVQGGGCMANDASHNLMSPPGSAMVGAPVDGNPVYARPPSLTTATAVAQSFPRPVSRGSFEACARHISDSYDDVVPASFTNVRSMPSARFIPVQAAPTMPTSCSRWTAEFDVSIDDDMPRNPSTSTCPASSGVQLDYWAHNHFTQLLRNSRDDDVAGGSGLELYLPRRALNARRSRTPSPQRQSVPRQIRRSIGSIVEVPSASSAPTRPRHAVRASSAGVTARRQRGHVEGCNLWQDELRGRPRQDVWRTFDCSLAPTLPLKIQALPLRSPRHAAAF